MNRTSPLSNVTGCALVAWFACVVVCVGDPAQAQGRSGIDDPFDSPAFRHSIGAPLTVDILDSDSTGISLRVQPERPAAGDDVPLSYCALIGVPPGELGPVEIAQVSFFSAGESAVQTLKWHQEGAPEFGSEVATVEELGWLRHQRIARLIVRPWMIEPEADVSPRLQSMTLRVQFDNYRTADSNWEDSATYERILRHSLVNYDLARGYRAPMQGSAPDLAALVPHPFAEHLAITTSGTGFFAISGAELVQAGVDISKIDPDTLQLWHLGREIPLLLENGSGRMTDETVAVFFAPPIPSELADRAPANVLGLSWNGNQGLRMETTTAISGREAEQVTGLRTTRRIETERVRIENDRQLGDSWFSHRLSAERGGADSCFLVIPELQSIAPGQTASLTLALHGLTDVPGQEYDHHVRIIVNNRWTKDFFWKGKTPLVVQEELSSDLLFEGDNIVEVRATGELDVFADQILVDWVELEYPTWGESGGIFAFSDRRDEPGAAEYTVYGRRGPQVRVFETSDEYHPVLISKPTTYKEDMDTVVFQVDWPAPGRRTFSVTSIDALPSPRFIDRNPGGHDLIRGMPQTDMIIVTHPSLRAGLDRFVKHRTDGGLRTLVVDTDDVYAFFSYGFPTAEGFRAFATAAVHAWPRPAPSFLLLVGDASNDPLDNLGYGALDLIPTHTSGDSNFPSDSWFGLVSGDDPITDLSIGRVSVTSASAAAEVFGKIIGYEAPEDSSHWKRRVLVVADDDRRQTYRAEASGAAEHMKELGFEVHGLYLDDLELEPGSGFATRIQRTNDEFFPRLRDAFNQGYGLIHYFGHGGHRVWAREHILDARPETPHLDQLKNRAHLPVILSFSCINAAFDTPRFETIAERLVNLPHGGAVAFWGSGSNNNPVIRWAVAAAVSDTCNEGGPLRLGTALAIATLDTIRANGFMEDAAPDANILLGDPALVLDFPISPQQLH